MRWNGLSELYKRYPKALIIGHSDLDPHKPCCSGFDVLRVYRRQDDVRARRFACWRQRENTAVTIKIEYGFV